MQDNKADVIDKYLPDEVRALKNAGELPDSVKLNETEDGRERIAARTRSRRRVPALPLPSVLAALPAIQRNATHLLVFFTLFL